MVSPSVMQCVLAVRETVVIKPSRLKILAQGLSKREVAQHLHLMVSHNTTLVPLLRSCIGPSREAGLSTDT